MKTIINIILTIFFINLLFYLIMLIPIAFWSFMCWDISYITNYHDWILGGFNMVVRFILLIYNIILFSMMRFAHLAGGGS